MRRGFWVLVFALLACGDDDGATDAGTDVPMLDANEDSGEDDAGRDAAVMDWPDMRPEASTVPEEGVRRDLFLVPGTTPAANPTTDESTPTELNATQVVRYRRDETPPAPARAIVVAMPGFLGGGGSFEGAARSMVRNGLDGEPIEVWAIDRRSNLLEDLRGADAAEALGNPEVAQGYYYGGETVGGVAFEGYVGQDDVSYMSEWGLQTHVEDLRAVIQLIEASERQARVFLMGHSLGASFTEAYAAWRFEDGTRAVDDLAGLILVDGALGGTELSETEYREGGMGGSPVIPSRGLNDVRESTRYVALPLLGVEALTRAEIISLRALEDPDGVIEDVERDRFLGVLMEMSFRDIPTLSNRAALALAFDNEFQPLGFLRTKAGELSGPVELYESALGGGAMLLRPSDPDGEYAWVDALDAEPAEFTPVQNMAESFAHGRTNFAEWYFPSRLPLDLGAVGGASVAEDGWQADEGLRAFDGALIDAPVLAIAAELVGDVARYEAIRDRIAPAVGDGRPAAGVTRDDERAFRIVDATNLAHLDVVFAGDESEDNPMPAAVEDFLREHTAAGTITIEAM